MWVLEYQDERGYLRKKRFGSYKQAMNFIKQSGNVLIKISKEAESNTSKDEVK